jgi:hypothetical protein
VSELQDVFGVARAFDSFKGPWWISGGWAIDLHLGRVSRSHHDVDVLVLRRDQEALHSALGGFELKKIVPHPEGAPRQATSQVIWREGTIVPWDPGERLELPIHQVNAYPTGSSEMAFQIMFGETDGAEWWYRRDARVRRRLDAIGYKGQQETPYLAPEIMLLFKAKTIRAYDQSDFDAVLPMLTGEARRWLHGALTIAHPNHPWIARLK